MVHRIVFLRRFLVVVLLGMLMACNNNDNNADTRPVNIIDNTTTIIATSTITLTQIGRFLSGVFDQGAAESVAHDPGTQRLFVTNGNEVQPTVDVLNISDPTTPRAVGTLAVDTVVAGGRPTSVAVRDGVVAVAIVAANPQNAGRVGFFDASTLDALGSVRVGSGPDMLVFTPDGTRVLVANEGGPNAAYTVDPEGSISIIDLTGGVAAATVATATFTAFNAQKEALMAQGVRIFGPESNVDEPDDIATVAQDMEPEYIAVSDDSRTAWVTLQENNALAVLDIATVTVTEILPLGTKNHRIPGNEFDASDADGGIHLRSWPVLGMYQPDAIATYRFNSATFLVTANEGDSRDYAGFSEVQRVGAEMLELSPLLDPDGTLKNPENLGRLKISTVDAFNNNGEVDVLQAFGGRSFAIWDDQGQLVYDSGNDFEVRTATRLGEDGFNSDNDSNASGDTRSDDRGPEPEGLVLGRLAGHTYAFIGLERVGGIMVYDISQPESPQFVQYVNNRDFTFRRNPAAARTGDLGPEVLVFIDAEQSPNDQPLLVVSHEVSGTTTIYQITVITLSE